MSIKSAYTEYLADERTIIGDLQATLHNYGLLPDTVNNPQPLTAEQPDEPLTLAELPTSDDYE